MFASSSLKSIFALFFALVSLIALSSAAPLTSSQLATRSQKIEAIRAKLEQKKQKASFANGNKTAQEHSDYHAIENWRGSKKDSNPQDCGFGRITCPVSYNGIGHPVCDFGNCKLECPRGLRQFFSRHPEFPSFCA